MQQDSLEPGKFKVNLRVTRFIRKEENNQPNCTGVVLERGKVLKTRQGVICNATLWNMAKLLKDRTLNPLSYQSLLLSRMFMLKQI